jgi:Domain of unknown function (DUF4190)/TIR domain
MKVTSHRIMPAPGEESIFVCYRRSDSADTVDRIYEVLKKDFAHQKPFRDIDSIPIGIDFSTHILRALDACSVVLVVIGPGWLDAQSEDGRRRLDDPGDHVRVEIETALRVEGLRVIPVFIRNATVPSREHVPDSIRGLVARSGLSIRPDPDFRGDMSRLIKTLRTTIAEFRQLRLQRQRQNENEQRVSVRQPQAPSTRNSGLAIASLVCSLVFAYGTIPAIICGHLARSQIRQNSSLLGANIALAGLIIGYISLAILIVVIMGGMLAGHH